MLVRRTERYRRFKTDDWTVQNHVSTVLQYFPFSPVAEEPNLAISGNNRFSAFFSSLYDVVQESVGCTDFHPLAFSKFKMASKML